MGAQVSQPDTKDGAMSTKDEEKQVNAKTVAEEEDDEPDEW